MSDKIPIPKLTPAEQMNVAIRILEVAADDLFGKTPTRQERSRNLEFASRIEEVTRKIRRTTG